MLELEHSFNPPKPSFDKGGNKGGFSREVAMGLKKGISAFFVLSFLLTPALNAEETVNLSIEECVELGFKNNFEIKKSRYDLLSARERIEQVKSRYEPSITCELGKTDRKTSGANPLYGTENKKDTLNAGLNKKLYPTGGLLSLEWQNEKNDSNSIFSSFDPTAINPLYDSEITLSYVQPLLKNFAGRNDKSSIRISRLGENTADIFLALQKNILAHTIEKAYLDINFARENLKSKNASLERAKTLLAINKDKLKDGLIEKVDIIATEAAVIIREASILLAGDSIKDARDNLKRIIGLNNDKKYSFITGLPAEPEHRRVFEEDIIQKALSQRLELKMLENNININLLNNKIKKNEKLPSLDLVTQYGLNSSGEEWDDNYDSISSGDYPVWYVGLSLTIFPFKKQSSSLLRESGYSYKKSAAELEDIKLAIKTECKSITRKVNTRALYVKAAGDSLKLQKKKLELEERKFNQGRSAIQWILNFQDDLNEAEVEFYRARTDYYKAKADLKLITGENR